MLSTLLFALSAIIIIWLVQYHWLRRRLYRMAAKHNGPTPLPLIGNALIFTGSNEDKLNNAMDLMASYKSPVTVWLGQRLFFGITDAKHLEVVLNHPNALEKEELYQLAFPAIGHALLTAPVSIWKKHRKLILPTFNQRKLDAFVEIFSEQSQILVNELEKHSGKEKFDIFPYFCLFSLDAICETSLGMSINAQTTETLFVHSVSRCMEIIFNRMFVIWYHFDSIFNLTSMSKELQEKCENVHSLTRAIIKEKKMAYKQQIKDPNAPVEEDSRKKITFLQQFIELSEEGEHLTDTEMLNEVVLMMVAGSETTASINSLTNMMLGMHPDIQEKVYKEVIDTIGNDRPIEYKDLPKLHYLEMVIKETMRLFPVGPLIVRAVTGDIQLDENDVIPGGSSAVICIIHVHRDPKIWPDPLRFDPLRFLPEECAKRHTYSYLPFSGGPRNCIGLKYAMMVMKTVIATVVRNYHIKCDYKSVDEIKIKQDIVLKPVDDYHVSLEKRTQNGSYSYCESKT